MTVRAINKTQFRLFCDGQGGKCPNHYIVENNQAALKAADDWLQRHGWRTIEGYFHYCKWCSARVPAFTSEQDTQEQERQLRAGRSGRFHQV